jgi:hypothetical protein
VKRSIEVRLPGRSPIIFEDKMTDDASAFLTERAWTVHGVDDFGAFWRISATYRDTPIVTVSHMQEDPRDVMELARRLHEKRLKYYPLDAEGIVTTERSDEIPEPLPASGSDRDLPRGADDPAASAAGDGVGGLSGVDSRAGVDEPQDSAANAAPLDAEFTDAQWRQLDPGFDPNTPEPQTRAELQEPPPEPPADASAGHAGGYGGMMIDDARQQLAARVDEAAKPRLEACDEIIRNTPMQAINNARMLGQVTDEQAAQEAAYYAAGSKRLAVVETARKIKEQVWKAGPEMLATINPAEPSLWPT